MPHDMFPFLFDFIEAKVKKTLNVGMGGGMFPFLFDFIEAKAEEKR